VEVHTCKQANGFIYMETEDVASGFQVFPLSKGFLHLVKNAEVQIRYDSRGEVEVLLIGTSFKVSEDSLGFEDIKNEEDVQVALNGWTGRYVLYAFGKFYNDACGLRHIYYGIVNGFRFISSSIYLIKQFVSLKTYDNAANLVLHHPMNWIPGPLTRYHNVFVILPFHSLDEDLCLESLKIFPSMSELKKRETQNIVEEIIELGHYISNAICEDRRPKYLALTGGHDSRTLFSFFKDKAYRDFHLIQMDHPNIRLWDIMAFRKISKYYGFKTIFKKRKPNNFDASHLSEFDRYCDDTCVDEDRSFYAYGQLDVPVESLMLRGNVSSEIFRLKNYIKFKPAISSSEDMIFELQKKYGLLDEFKVSALKEWYRFRIEKDELNRDVDWRILFWLDQRSCSWAGAIDGSTDISAYRYLNPFNSQRVMCLFYELSMRMDTGSDFQELIIAKIDQVLLDIPFNKSDSAVVPSKFMQKLVSYYLRNTTI
jgi:hypothetical protein